MNGLVAVVALAVLITGAGSGASSPSASITVDPPIAVPPQVTRIKIRVVSDEALSLIVALHPGTSSCAATVWDEFERWPEPLGASILETNTRPGIAVATATWYGQPGTYRTCAYFDSKDRRNLIIATATFKIRALNRVMKIGRGLGPWRLNERYVRRAGYQGRYPDEPARSCRPFWEAARVDTYNDQIVVAWVGRRLVGVRTYLRGDRSEDGFAIGTARISTVRARHPNLRLRSSYFNPGGGNRRLFVISKKTATGVVELRYWFDERSVLLALETSERRC